MGRAQIAIEYLALIGFVMVVLGGIGYVYLEKSTQVQSTLTISQAETVLGELEKSINQLYSYGGGSQTLVKVSFPGGVKAITAPDNGAGGSDIVITITNPNGGDSEIAKTFPFDIELGNTFHEFGGDKSFIVKTKDDGGVFVAEISPLDHLRENVVGLWHLDSDENAIAIDETDDNTGNFPVCFNHDLCSNTHWCLDDLFIPNRCDSESNLGNGGCMNILLRPVAECEFLVEGENLVNAWNFDGFRFKEVSDTGNFDFTNNEFTLSVWFKKTSTERGDIFNWKNAGDDLGVISNAGSTTTFDVYYKIDGVFGEFGSTPIDNSGPFTLNEWHNFIVTKDLNGNFKSYVNGQPDKEETSDLDLSNMDAGTSMRFGANRDILNGDDPIYLYEGLLDEIIIFNKALTEDEINMFYGLQSTEHAFNYY